MENQKRKKITGYTIIMSKMLGEGACGKVYVGEQDNTKLKVAVKILEKKTVDRDYYLKSSLFSEIQILKVLKSPNIVGFLDVMESKHCYYIIQQFCDGGDFRGMLKKKGKFPQKQAIHMMKQICNGFVELIKEGIMHRDLKPENILVHQGQLKLADFGFSKKDRAKRMSAQTMVGTPMYMSIQILKGMPYSSKCDIWALGCIFYEMVFGKNPWTGNSEYELIRNIQTQPLKFPYEVSKSTKDFLSKCLAKDETKRFTWDDLLRHQIFQGYFAKKIEQNKKFQNKFKAIMNNIRQQVKENQIDLESNFKNLGVNKGSSVNLQQFQSLLKSVDQNITKQQISYIFNKIVQHGNKTISYQQFQKALQKSGIPMTMIRKQEEAREKVGNHYGQMNAMNGMNGMNGMNPGLFDMLVNQVINPNEQGMNAYMKNQQMGAGMGMNAMGMGGGMGNMNAMNQMAMLQQQQQQMMGGYGGMGGGMGNMGAMGMGAMGGMGMNGMNGMNGMGMGGMGGMGGQMMALGQMGGGGYANNRGWI